MHGIPTCDVHSGMRAYRSSVMRAFDFDGEGDALPIDTLLFPAKCGYRVVELPIDYNERVGALTVVAADKPAADKAFSHVKTVIRANYSNPPSHGGAIVTKILSTPKLRKLWEAEVAEMRGRINGMRHALVDELKKQGVDRDFSFIARQRGMFSFSGLTKQQVERLRDEFGVYIVGSGRISIAGLNTHNLGPLCAAIAKVL